MSGWGNGIVDFDNDGWKDLFVARANVMDNISVINPARHYGEPNTIFRNLGKGNSRTSARQSARTFKRKPPIAA